MNKYKMISICSLTIACVLMLSILLPSKTIANDKESIELSMHYENSQVTANITVNSDIYTGIVCKYFMIDDVLKCDDILAQTRENGISINLDKSEDDKYTAVIPNVNKRYVVIFVSIGNCSLCDYIDCEPNKLQNKDGKPEAQTEDSPHNISVVGEGENGQTVVAQTDNKQQQQENKDKDSKQVEGKKEENIPKGDENVQPAVENTQNQNNKEENNQNQNGESKIVVDNSNQNESEFQTIEELVSAGAAEKTQTASNEDQSITTNLNTQLNTNSKDVIDVTAYDKSNVNVSKKDEVVTNRNQSPSRNTGDKDSVDTTDFEEIEKVISTSTVDVNMPQTGEDDFIKILGIFVFSAISIVSFYKYKKTK